MLILRVFPGMMGIYVLGTITQLYILEQRTYSNEMTVECIYCTLAMRYL